MIEEILPSVSAAYDPNAFVHAARRSEWRAAYLLAGDLVASVDYLRRTEPDLSRLAEGPRTLPLELAEVSTIAGRCMVTAIGQGLRLTAITERLPGARVGETVHIALPEAPSAWYAPTGERIG